MQAMSLAEDDAESEQPEIRVVQEQMRALALSVKDLAKNLEDIKQV
jgi:hypothetical protein